MLAVCRTTKTRYGMGETGSGGEDAATTAAGTAARRSETFVMGLECVASDFVLDGGVGGE